MNYVLKRGDKVRRLYTQAKHPDITFGKMYVVVENSGEERETFTVRGDSGYLVAASKRVYHLATGEEEEKLYY